MTTLIDNIRAATETLNSHLIEAARLGVNIEVFCGITPPMQDSVDKTHFYVAKTVAIVAKQQLR